MSVQDKKRFVKRLNFMTTPGWLKGGESREQAGLPAGSGPYRVISNMGVMDFEPDTKRMRVISVNPGYKLNDIQNNCEFELLKATRVFTTKPPTAMELRILREEIDPHRHIIGS